MSFNVLVIPEDPTWNGYILRPLVERVCREVGRPNANVTVLSSPRLNGFEQAVSTLQSADFHLRYKHMHLWIFLPDGDLMTDAKAEHLTADVSAMGTKFLCCAAQPEIEIWLLAGHREKLPIPWANARIHPRLKEDVFTPFLRQYGIERAAGGGRKELTIETLANYDGLKTLCPELAQLEAQLRALLDPR
jgi:hypothetical protein